MVRDRVSLHLVRKNLLFHQIRLDRTLAARFVVRLSLRGVHQVELLNLAVRVVGGVRLCSGKILDRRDIRGGILPVLRDGRQTLGRRSILRLNTRQVRQQPAGAWSLTG